MGNNTNLASFNLNPLGLNAYKEKEIKVQGEVDGYERQILIPFVSHSEFITPYNHSKLLLGKQLRNPKLGNSLMRGHVCNKGCTKFNLETYVEELTSLVV